MLLRARTHVVLLSVFSAALIALHPSPVLAEAPLAQDQDTLVRVISEARKATVQGLFGIPTQFAVAMDTEPLLADLKDLGQPSDTHWFFPEHTRLVGWNLPNPDALIKLNVKFWYRLDATGRLARSRFVIENLPAIACLEPGTVSRIFSNGKLTPHLNFRTHGYPPSEETWYFTWTEEHSLDTISVFLGYSPSRERLPPCAIRFGISRGE